MNWNPEQLVADFLRVAELAEMPVQRDIGIEALPMPHGPRSLPKGKMGVYVFSDKERVLKVGKAGPRSKARWTSQHYNAGSAPSTLAGSLLKDKDAVQRYGLDEENVSGWIKENTDRVNFLLDADEGIWILTLLEAFSQCRLKPVFEGFANQR